MKKHKITGFTLIELMITLAVASLLAGIAYASYSSVVVKTKRTEAKTALMKLMQQEERYFTQNTTYVAFSKATNASDTTGFIWYSGDGAARSAYEISGSACQGETIQNCVLLTATPGTANVDANFKDPLCGSLTLSSNGTKGFTGTGTKDQCW